MATQHLNLEEQEQLAQLKQFWADYGRTIILAVLIFITVVVGWYTWEWWQAKQARESAVLYEEMTVAIEAGNPEKVKLLVTQIQSDHKSTHYASLASLIGASYLHQKDDLDAAASFLTWVKDNGKDKGWSALAVLRLADVLTDQKKYDEALSVLSTSVESDFLPHVADKRGNVYVALEDTEKAKQSFLEAYEGLVATEHKIFVARKLSFLGVDVLTPASAPVEG